VAAIAGGINQHIIWHGSEAAIEYRFKRGALNNQLQNLGEFKVLRWRNQKSIARS